MKRLRVKILLCFVNSPFISGRLRASLYRLAGFKIGKGVYIGRNVVLDDYNIDGLEINDRAMITSYAVLLTHYYDVKRSLNNGSHTFTKGTLVIGEGAFVGAGAVLCSPVCIGKQAIIPACARVTRNALEGEIYRENAA